MINTNKWVQYPFFTLLDYFTAVIYKAKQFNSVSLNNYNAIISKSYIIESIHRSLWHWQYCILDPIKEDLYIPGKYQLSQDQPKCTVSGTLISMVWTLAVSGVKDTRQRPPPSTCTWLGTSPSLMLISSWPSPAWDASTAHRGNTINIPSPLSHAIKTTTPEIYLNGISGSEKTNYCKLFSSLKGLKLDQNSKTAENTFCGDSKASLILTDMGKT